MQKFVWSSGCVVVKVFAGRSRVPILGLATKISEIVYLLLPSWHIQNFLTCIQIAKCIYWISVVKVRFFKILDWTRPIGLLIV